MIRKLLMFALILAMAVPTVEARRGGKRAGKIDDNVYKDNKYDFTLTLTEEWDAKVQRNDDEFRMVMLKERYEIPMDYQDAPDYTQVPRLVLFVHEDVQLGAIAMLDSLLSDSYGSDVKDEMMKEFEILHLGAPGEREDLVTKGRETFEVDGERGILWTGQVRYMKEIQSSASSLGGRRVRGGYGGAIAFVKKDDLLVGFHLITEWEFFQQNLTEAMKVIETLDFKGNDEEKD